MWSLYFRLKTYVFRAMLKRGKILPFGGSRTAVKQVSVTWAALADDRLMQNLGNRMVNRNAGNSSDYLRY